jgi:hypothetical protein
VETSSIQVPFIRLGCHPTAVLSVGCEELTAATFSN